MDWVPQFSYQIEVPAEVWLVPTGERLPNPVFEFRLCKRQVQLGPLSLRQWWMPHQSVFPDRKRKGVNYQPIVDCYWSLCHQSLTLPQEENQRIFLLASLLPDVRSDGARRVVADAIGDKKAGDGRKEEIANLELALCADIPASMDVTAFRNLTGNLIGPSKEYISSHGHELHQTLQLMLEQSREMLEREGQEPALEHLRTRWEAIKTPLTRRGGREEEKRCLDVFSYEARTAFVRCYAAVWTEIISKAGDEDQLNETERNFHLYWHGQHFIPDPDGEGPTFFMFHGLAPALHPAMSLFMQTQTGPRLLGEWLADPSSIEAHNRCLYAMSKAVAAYALLRDPEKSDRKEAQGMQGLRESGYGKTWQEPEEPKDERDERDEQADDE